MLWNIGIRSIRRRRNMGDIVRVGVIMGGDMVVKGLLWVGYIRGIRVVGEVTVGMDTTTTLIIIISIIGMGVGVGVGRGVEG
jgi:hypothetical protein